MAVEARYVGTFGREIWRGTDYNQVQISPEFLADFNRARSNGFLAQQAGLAFSPAFNPAVPGSQPLTVLPSFGDRLLNNTNVITNLQTNQVGALADFYLTQPASARAPAAFMQNPGIYASQAIANGGFSDYNSLQLELRRQFRNGFFGQMNYTLSRTPDTTRRAPAQNRFEAFMDNIRPDLNTGRSVFHVTHVINANAIYELPFGNEQEVAELERASSTRSSAAGRSASIVAWQSGSPVSIISGRGTFNRAGRSNCPRPDQLQHGLQHAVGRRDQERCSASTSRSTNDLLDRSEGHRHGDGPRRRRRQPGQHRRLRRPGVLQPGRGTRSATCRSWRSTVRRSSASTWRSRSASGSRIGTASSSRARRST